MIFFVDFLISHRLFLFLVKLRSLSHTAHMTNLYEDATYNYKFNYN